MVMIGEMKYEKPTLIEGLYRLQKTIWVTTNGEKRLDAILADRSGCIRCEEWDPGYSTGEFLNQIFRCTLLVDRKKGSRMVLPN